MNRFAHAADVCNKQRKKKDLLLFLNFQIQLNARQFRPIYF